MGFTKCLLGIVNLLHGKLVVSRRIPSKENANDFPSSRWLRPMAQGSSAAGQPAVCFFRPSVAILIWGLCHRRHDCLGSPESRWCKRETRRQCMGRCRGGLTTKIVGLVETLDNLVRPLLPPGQAHESKGLAPQAVIPPRRTQESVLLRQGSLQVGHLIENFFARLKVNPVGPQDLKTSPPPSINPGRKSIQGDTGTPLLRVSSGNPSSG